MRIYTDSEITELKRTLEMCKRQIITLTGSDNPMLGYYRLLADKVQSKIDTKIAY